ncbi:uncharacterized protein [Prorops nasuta]|uniref:uncharacterized protein n=1 Tax=Prorops nasuta TaxID=863751 RepID=UPI0034CE9F1E
MAKVNYSFILFTLLGSSLCTDVKKGNCQCAVFPANSTAWSIVHNLHANVTCDKTGSEMCQKLCLVLGRGLKDQAPSSICARLRSHVENLKVDVHARACNETNWTFTGLRSGDPICCHDGRAVSCKTLYKL